MPELYIEEDWGLGELKVCAVGKGFTLRSGSLATQGRRWPFCGRCLLGRDTSRNSMPRSSLTQMSLEIPSEIQPCSFMNAT